MTDDILELARLYNDESLDYGYFEKFGTAGIQRIAAALLERDAEVQRLRERGKRLSVDIREDPDSAAQVIMDQSGEIAELKSRLRRACELLHAPAYEEGDAVPREWQAKAVAFLREVEGEA